MQLVFQHAWQRDHITTDGERTLCGKDCHNWLVSAKDFQPSGDFEAAQSALQVADPTSKLCKTCHRKAVSVLDQKEQEQ